MTKNLLEKDDLMRCRGAPPTGGEQRVRKAGRVSWIQVGGGAELEELSSVHNYSLSDFGVQ